MAEGLVKGSGVGVREWRENFQLINDAGTVCFQVEKATGNVTALGTVTSAGAVDSNGNLTISNTGPWIKLSDTTGSAKDLTIIVDGDFARIRESAGAAGSLLSLDLTNNRLGIATAAPAVALDVTGAIAASTTVTAGTNLVATAGSVAAATTVTGGTGVTATAGNVTASAGNIVGVKGLLSGDLAFAEMTAPTGVANKAIIYAKDNGAGKTQLMVIFPTGVEQQLAIEA